MGLGRGCAGFSQAPSLPAHATWTNSRCRPAFSHHWVFFLKFHGQTPSLCGLTARLPLGIPSPSCCLFELVSTGQKGKLHLRAGTTVVERRQGNQELGRDSYMEIPVSALQGPPGTGRLISVYCL